MNIDNGWKSEKTAIKMIYMLNCGRKPWEKWMGMDPFIKRLIEFILCYIRNLIIVKAVNVTFAVRMRQTCCKHHVLDATWSTFMTVWYVSLLTHNYMYINQWKNAYSWVQNERVTKINATTTKSITMGGRKIYMCW